MSNITDGRDDATDLKQDLQSLKPRTTIDCDQLLSRLQAESAPPRLAEPQPVAAQSRHVRRWPMLTALSWLVTAGVWWSSTQTTATRGSKAAGVMAAVSTNEGDTSSAAVVVGTSSMNQLGESLDGVEHRTAVESPVLVESQGAPASPIWLAMLGIDVSGFTAFSPEERWERMQAEADAPRQLTSVQTASVASPSATYASLRDEFDTPLRRNWLSQ